MPTRSRTSTPTNPWQAAFLVLPGARAGAARRVRDPESFADEALELPSAIQVGWKLTPQGLLDELEGRFAPKHYLSHKRTAKGLLIWREDEDGHKETALIPKVKDPNEAILGALAALTGQAALALSPHNDGDDLDYLFVTQKVRTRLGQLLGRHLSEALRDLPPPPPLDAQPTVATPPGRGSMVTPTASGAPSAPSARGPRRGGTARRLSRKGLS